MKNNYSEWEFILLCEDRKSIQTKLNQWRHNYLLNIIAMSNLNDVITILVARKDFE